MHAPLPPAPGFLPAPHFAPQVPGYGAPPPPSQPRPEARVNSTVDPSSTDDSDGEDIDVVRSAFTPIKTASRESQHPDSTVQECPKEAPAEAPPTKIRSSPVISAPKSVWRPY